MAQIDARGWVFQVSDGAATPAWLEIGRLTEFKHNPAEGEETTDTTTFQSNGMQESRVMQRGAQLELTGKWEQSTATTPVKDPGQARVEALAALVGEASVGRFRFRHVSVPQWVVWDATFSLGEQGGANNDKTSWGAKVTRTGAPTTATVP